MSVTDQVVEDLVADYASHFKRLLISDRIDDHIAVDTDEVLRVENAVFILQAMISCLATTESCCRALENLCSRVPEAHYVPGRPYR